MKNEVPSKEVLDKVYFADLHVHTRFSRATSKDMTVATLAKAAKEKGLAVVGTGDFTHPLYFKELQMELAPADEPGLYLYRKDPEGPKFILSTEVSNIFTQAGKTRRIHTLILAPSFEVVAEINRVLSRVGNLSADGRPTFGFPVKRLIKLLKVISPDILFIPAHAWTPWYSIFGSNSGFDSIEECFGDETEHIFAIETGLSSDPQMNWRLSSLDNITLISNSDAHSPRRLAREANAFFNPLSYYSIADAIKTQKVAFTIEFYPQEGKYHYDGHRSCNVVLSPKETKKLKGICPVCKKPLTIGVMHRVEELADRPEGFKPPNKPSAVHLIPLEEIIAEALGVNVESAAVRKEYKKIVDLGGSELRVLLYLSKEELSKFVPPRILEGIIKMREGNVHISPGYDGVYGKISIFKKEKDKERPSAQLSLPL